jgi:hypothetical protein
LTFVADEIARDRYSSTHTTYMLRELRLVLYKQFLAPYRLVDVCV